MASNFITMQGGRPIPRPTIPAPAPPISSEGMLAVKYSIIGQQYQGNQDVEVDERCNGWTAINKGGKKCFVNGIPLEPPPSVGMSGESFSIGGNIGEVYTGRIQIQTDPTDTTPLVIIIQKYYL